MTDRDTLLALAARCEAAKLPLPDRTLNRAIARAVGWGYQSPSEARRANPAWFHPEDCRNGKPVFDSLHGTDVWREPLNYVGSLDAAMTLVPSPGKWSVTAGHKGDWQACVWVEGAGFMDWRSAASPALALTAAALRALGREVKP
jgi:hypothetical protein